MYASHAHRRVKRTDEHDDTAHLHQPLRSGNLAPWSSHPRLPGAADGGRSKALRIQGCRKDQLGPPGRAWVGQFGSAGCSSAVRTDKAGGQVEMEVVTGEITH